MSHQHIFPNLYREVFDILDDSGVFSSPAFSGRPGASNPVKYTSDGFPWIRDLALAIEKIYHQVIKLHSRTGELGIIHGRSWNELGGDDVIFDVHARYGCIFPGKILYLCQQVRIDDDNKYSVVPREFLVFAKWLKPLLTSGLALLLPTRTYSVHPGLSVNASRASSFHYWTDPNKIHIEGINVGIDSYNEISTVAGVTNLAVCRALLSPTIIGASIEDLVAGLGERYEDFSRYADAATRYLKHGSSDSTTLSDWIAELDDRARVITEAHEVRVKAMRRSGIDCGIGIALTAFAQMTPHIPEEIKSTISAFFASKSIFEGMKFVSESRKLREEHTHGQLWALWRNAPIG